MNRKKLSDAYNSIVNFNVDEEKKYLDGYLDVVTDILNHPKFEEMVNFNHHSIINCHFHSVFVSFISYKLNLLYGYSVEEATRASLLHDFYLYDWHIVKHDELHAWYHPKQAKKNAELCFGELTEKQQDMILSHMWPLHLAPPKSKEGMILTLADKICTCYDLMKLSNRFLPLYNEILKEAKDRVN